MRCNLLQHGRYVGLVLGGLLILPASVAMAVTATVTFQNGLNGYTGTVDRRLHEAPGGTPPNTYDGATRTQLGLDGYDAAVPSPDAQGLIRFENIIGNNPGQIPANATILSAQLTATTSTAGAAQSAGPWGIAQLLQPFGRTTDPGGGTQYSGDGSMPNGYVSGYTCAGCGITSRGPWWQDGYSNRPLTGYGGNWQGEVATADVTAIVQNWANGQQNNGVAIQAGFGGAAQAAATSDGWNILSTGHPLIDVRPKLTVTYTTDAVEFNTFQRGLNSYASDTMAYVRSGTNIYGTTTEPDTGKDDITFDGITGQYTVAANTTIAAPANLTNFQVFLDGPQFPNDDISGTASSADQLALVKFGGVFGTGANQAPSDVPVAKAWLVISGGTNDTGFASFSNGDWAVHKVLRSWDSTTLHSGFGSRAGLQVSDGDIEAALDVQTGMIFGADAWFDVTSYLEGVRTGATDNGLAVLTTNTADGWQIHLNGSPTPDEALRPRLVVASGQVTIVNPTVPGDYNGNGVVDGADYVLWRNGGPLQNEVVTIGSVTPEDYTEWRSRFGNTGGGGPLGSGVVPEPGTGLLLLAAALAICVGHRKRS
jgi:hypothetical protein